MPSLWFRYEDILEEFGFDKAEEILEYKPTITLEEGLKKTIDWYKSQSFKLALILWTKYLA